MTIIQSVVLGIIQGITEFLPISSSGHLILFSTLFTGEVQNLYFDIALHLGTAIAVLIYFWRDWYKMFVSTLIDFKKFPSNFKTPSKLKPDTKLFLQIFVVLIPVVIIALLFEDTIEYKFRTPLYVSLMLIIGALLMVGAEFYMKFVKKADGVKNSIGLKEALVISLSQVLALIPGTSRSGITITAGMFSKVSAADAAKFSFLLSTPLIFGAVLTQIPDLLHAPSEDLLITLIGFVSSLITGYLVIKWLLKFLRKHSLWIFIIYRIMLGILILLLVY